MADLIVRLLQSTVSSLVVDPYREGEEDAEYGSERGGGVDEVVNGVGDGVEKTKDAKVLPSSILSSLPPPLVPGNYEMNRACLLNVGFLFLYMLIQYHLYGTKCSSIHQNSHETRVDNTFVYHNAGSNEDISNR